MDVSVALHWEVCPEVKYMMLLAGGWGRGWNPFFVLPIDPRVNRGLPSICRPACSRGQTMMGIFIGVMRINVLKFVKKIFEKQKFSHHALFSRE